MDIRLFFVGCFIINLVHIVSQCEAYKSCTKQGCGCKTDTGEIVDLQQFTKVYTASTKDYNYNYKTCTEQTCSSSTASVCQSSKDNVWIYSCGNLNSQSFQVNSDGNVQVIYTATDQMRKSEITILCDSKLTGEPTLTATRVDSTGTPSVYYFDFKSSKFCAGGSGGGGESQVGTILVGLFFGLLALYFIVGVLINLFYRKRSGIEILPNHDFWLSLPGLIKDGFMFVFGRFCRPSGYQEKI